MEHEAQVWSDVVNVTGGKLAPHKCKWQMLAYDYSTCPPTLQQTPQGEIHLHDHRGATTKIEKLNSDEPNVGLGCRLAPDGNQQQEFLFRETQCQDLAGCIATAHLNITETYSMLMQRIIPCTTYPMGLTSFSTKQCKRLNTIIDEIIIPKLTMNRHTPKAALYSPLSKAGLNYPSYKVIQDQKNILLVLQQLRLDSTITNDIRVALSALQLVSGLTTPIYEDTTTKLPHLPQGLLTHIRDRMMALKATMWIENIWHPTLQRTNDRSLMKTFANIPKVGKTRLERANYCRLYMRITTIADLSNIRGNTIPSGRLEGTWRAETNIRAWPTIPKPPPHFWDAFRWCVRHSIATKTNVLRRHKTIQLDTPLGAWFPTPRNTTYEYYRTFTTAYRRYNKGFLVYTEPTTGNIFTINKTTLRLPLEAHPIEANHDDTEIWTSFQYNTLPKTPLPDTTMTTTSTQYTGPPRAGSDASVDPFTGDSSCAFTVRAKGTNTTGRQ